MEKYKYYLKIDELLTKIKEIKKEVEASNDEEKTNYLKLALNLKYEEVRELMESQYKS